MPRKGEVGHRCPECNDDGLVEDTEGCFWPCYNCGGSVILTDDPVEQAYRVWRIALKGAPPPETQEHEAFSRVAAALRNPLLTRLQKAEQMLRRVLESATPSLRDHPTMHSVWGDAAELLGEPRDKYRIPTSNVK